MKFKLDENLPVSAASVLAAAGHDVDTVPGEHLAGRPDHDIVAASTAAERVLISLDVGLGDIRAYPPGRHAGIVILRLADQSAATVIKAIGDLARLSPTASPRRSLCCNVACCVSAIPDQLRGRLRLQLGAEIHGPERAELITRIASLEETARRLATERDARAAEASHAQQRIRELEDELTAARESLRRAIRQANR